MKVTEQEKKHFFELGKPEQEVTILYKDIELAKTKNALLLKEIGKTIYDPVYYIPREDVKFELFTTSNNSTHCPIKGDASYFNFEDGSEDVENIAWSYEDPLPRSKQIKGYMAFYSNFVTCESKLAPKRNFN